MRRISHAEGCCCRRCRPRCSSDLSFTLEHANFQAPANVYVTLALFKTVLIFPAYHCLTFSGLIPIVLENSSCYYPVATGSVSWQPVPEPPGLCVIVFIIGGCVEGAGAGIARRFAREGYAVALVSRSKETLQPITEQIRKSGGQALAVPADTGDQPCHFEHNS